MKDKIITDPGNIHIEIHLKPVFLNERIESTVTRKSMKRYATYNEAFDKLERLLGKLEGNDIPWTNWPKKVTEANELVVFCENQLKNIETNYPNNPQVLVLIPNAVLARGLPGRRMRAC